MVNAGINESDDQPNIVTLLLQSWRNRRVLREQTISDKPKQVCEGPAHPNSIHINWLEFEFISKIETSQLCYFVIEVYFEGRYVCDQQIVS